MTATLSRREEKSKYLEEAFILLIGLFPPAYLAIVRPGDGGFQDRSGRTEH